MSILFLLMSIISSAATFIHSFIIFSDIPISYTNSELVILYILSIVTVCFWCITIYIAKKKEFVITNFVFLFFTLSINALDFVGFLQLKDRTGEMFMYFILYITLLIIVFLFSVILAIKRKYIFNE